MSFISIKFIALEFILFFFKIELVELHRATEAEVDVEVEATVTIRSESNEARSPRRVLNRENANTLKNHS
jgi:hypothetical protein